MESEKISCNVKNIQISGIRKFYNKVSKYPDAISLTLGQPDFNVPFEIKEAMIKAIEENKTTYTSNSGIIELREAISQNLKTFGIDYNSNEICITVGGSEALMDVFISLMNPKDKVLLPSIAYPAYESCVKLLGGEIINYNLKKDFSIDINNLKEIIDIEKPKVMVLSYPSNPTGSILTEKERDEIYKIVKEKDILIISDEIYSSICFDNYYSIAQYNEIKDKVIIVSGFSKMFSMTGLRIGYVCAEKKFIDSIVKVHQYNVSCAPSIVQWGAYEGLKNCLKDVEYMKIKFIERRDYVYKRLTDLGFEVNLPKGAFYIFPKINNSNITSEEFCGKLLEETKVAVVPGSAFGAGGEGYFRISYAYSMEELKEALDRIEKFINK